MVTFIKNKKIFLLFPILFIVFSFFLIVSTRAECNDNCADCGSPGECSRSALNCRWDTNRNGCYLGLEIDWPLSPGGTVLDIDSDVGDMIQYFYEWAIALGGLATFFALVLGGFKYLSSMGRPEAMKEAREQITSAFAGLILLLSAWLILNVINPDLTTFNRLSYSLSYHLEGMGFNLAETNSCDYVILYDDAGIAIPTTGGETKIYEGSMAYLTAIPRSLRAFLNNEECAQDGCGCYIQLSIDDNGDGVCDDIVINYNAYSNDITEGVDPKNREKIKCAEVQGGGCNACYVKDDDDKCIYQGDTGWEDDEFLCVGRDRRCFEGECRTCKGIISEDGCDGCTAPSGSPSTLACWYLAPSVPFPHVVAAKSCNSVCKNKGGCIAENWNDTNRCDACRAYAGGQTCLTSDFLGCSASKSGNPMWNKYLYSGCYNACMRRNPSTSQNCGAGSDSGILFSANYNRRLCVCEF